MLSEHQHLLRRKEVVETDGFTLIEILIVIVILGVLAAVVIFALGGLTGKTAVAACQADGATVATAISVFNAQNPGTLATTPVGASGTGEEALLLDASASGFSGPYISSWPANGTHYAYGLVDGTLGLEWPSPSAGWFPTVAFVAASTPAQWATGGIYSGPTSCVGVM